MPRQGGQSTVERRKVDCGHALTRLDPHSKCLQCLAKVHEPVYGGCTTCPKCSHLTPEEWKKLLANRKRNLNRLKIKPDLDSASVLSVMSTQDRSELSFEGEKRSTSAPRIVSEQEDKSMSDMLQDTLQSSSPPRIAPEQEDRDVLQETLQSPSPPRQSLASGLFPRRAPSSSLKRRTPCSFLRGEEDTFLLL